MKRILTVILFCLFALTIIFFLYFGKTIRDYNSPHVEVMAPITYMFPDGSICMAALSNSCFSTGGDGINVAYMIEEKSDSGEKAYYAKQIEVILGQSDDRCTEVKKAPMLSALFICDTSRDITDGERVVINKIINVP